MCRCFIRQTPEKRTDMFVAMGKKLGMDLSRGYTPEAALNRP